LLKSILILSYYQHLDFRTSFFGPMNWTTWVPVP